MKHGIFQRIICLLCITALLQVTTACGSKSPLSPKDPVSLTVWHYYNGSQQAAFDALTEEFNDTAGRELGITVQGFSQGSVSDLETAVRAAVNGEVGADAMPDLFSSYADTAYELEQSGALANLSEYLSKDELDQYVDAYIDEGCIASDGSLRIFPVAKSTETLMLNQTDWEVFAEATGASLDSLRTIEGVVSTAEAYYQWTDSLTETPNDGKALYGRDAMANYFIIGMQQLGTEMFQVEGGEVTLQLPEDALRRLWENYYIPIVMGWFGAYGSFRSDDVKTGELLAYTGSTASSMYFPSQVELDGGTHPIDCLVLPSPVFEGGRNYAVQQGAGMVVSKSDLKHEYAAVEFLKWFTQADNNLRFGCVSGYFPVRKDANSTEALSRVISEQKLEVVPKTYDCLTAVFDEMENITLYTSKSFPNAYIARKVLEYNLADRAAEDRAAVVEAMAGGASLEEAAADYVSEDAFQSWYGGFCDALNAAVSQ